MLKLMKYEFKKQMFSKIIIAAILGVLTLYFGIACVIDKETHAAIATMLIFTVMVFAGLYVAVESLSVYGFKDQTELYAVSCSEVFL